jgi:hypothetical protein
VLAVDVVDERVGIEYFIVHCERAFAHLIEMAIEWCASWVLLRLSSPSDQVKRTRYWER